MTYAHLVLAKIDDSIIGNPPPKASIDTLLNDLSNHIKWLVLRHVKKINSEQYLIGCCYGKSRALVKEAEINAYCRSNLVLADRSFDRLLKIMRNSKGKISLHTARNYKEIIRPYIFDIQPIAEYLECKKDPKYVFLNGHRSSHVHTWEVFRVSRQLAIQSAHRKAPLHIDHKTAQIAAVFVLRQALEAKFDRLIGVDFYSSSHTRPRLPHGFNHDFIISNLKYFDFKIVDFSLLEKIYEWCNEIVHNVYHPVAWQIDYAHQTCAGLFESINYGPNAAWSINNAVEINHIDDMRNDYVDHFNKNYIHGKFWSIYLSKPEAVIV